MPRPVAHLARAHDLWRFVQSVGLSLRFGWASGLLVPDSWQANSSPVFNTLGPLLNPLSSRIFHFSVFPALHILLFYYKSSFCCFQEPLQLGLFFFDLVLVDFTLLGSLLEVLPPCQPLPPPPIPSRPAPDPPPFACKTNSRTKRFDGPEKWWLLLQDGGYEFRTGGGWILWPVCLANPFIVTVVVAGRLLWTTFNVFILLSLLLPAKNRFNVSEDNLIWSLICEYVYHLPLCVEQQRLGCRWCGIDVLSTRKGSISRGIFSQ